MHSPWTADGQQSNSIHGIRGTGYIGPMAQRSITVIGADDELGEAVVREALVRGLHVTATAAAPERVPTFSPALQVQRARSDSQEELEPAVRGCDAVVLGLSPRLDRDPSMRATDTAIAAVRAMRAAGVSRLVAVSSTELTDSSRLRGPLRRGLHRGGLQDLVRLERLLEGSGVDWTVLRSGRLTDLLGTRTPQVQQVQDVAVSPVPRDDLARALVDQALVAGSDPRVLAVRI